MEKVKCLEMRIADLEQALRERGPTRTQMLIALGTAGREAFLDGWTVRRCLDCPKPVAGGPTRCQRCVGKLEGKLEGKSEGLLEGSREADEKYGRLREAVREHRDQRGDNRCWLDDQKLYEAAGLEPAETAERETQLREALFELLRRVTEPEVIGYLRRGAHATALLMLEGAMKEAGALLGLVDEDPET